MTRIILSLVLCAVALPALAVEPAAATAPAAATTPKKVVRIQPGGADNVTAIVEADMPPELVAAEVARVNAETEALQKLTEAEVTRMAAETHPAAYRTAELDTGGKRFAVGGPFTFSTQVTDCIAAGTTNARNGKFKTLGEIIIGCQMVGVDQTEANVLMVRAQTEQMLAQAATENKQLSPLTIIGPDSSVTTVEQTGNLLALTAGGVGAFGTGLPYGASVTSLFQQNAMGVQAMLASQSLVVPQPGVKPPAEKPVAKAPVAAPPPHELTLEEKLRLSKARGLNEAGVKE